MKSPTRKRQVQHGGRRSGAGRKRGSTYLDDCSRLAVGAEVERRIREVEGERFQCLLAANSTEAKQLSSAQEALQNAIRARMEVARNRARIRGKLNTASKIKVSKSELTRGSLGERWNDARAARRAWVKTQTLCPSVPVPTKMRAYGVCRTILVDMSKCATDLHGRTISPRYVLSCLNEWRALPAGLEFDDDGVADPQPEPVKK